MDCTIPGCHDLVARFAIVCSMASELDPTALVERFRQRAEAVRRRGIPPVEGIERKRFVDQAKQDFMDFAIIADADAQLVDGVLTLRVDLTAPPAPPLPDDRPIALAGFMGVGKTSIGRLLARRLGRRFLDTDEMVEERAKRGIVDMISSGDEDAFRRAESLAIEEAVSEPRTVVALGGGALMDAANRDRIVGSAVLVHLDMDWAALEPRIDVLRSSRPLLGGRSIDEVHDLFLDRRQGYGVAHVRVSLGNEAPEEVVEEIVARLSELSLR